MSVYEKQIVHWIQPAATWMKNLKVGFLIPIAIFFIISFPPLFGQEILAIICGVVWGLWAGFGIVSAGTLLGELGNFFAFKYWCGARGAKIEKTSIFYACLARVIREGGFKIAVIARYSAIPGHFTTAIFATCGMNVLTFTIAAILSLPKQFMTVYIGVLLEESGTGTTSSSSKTVSDVVFAVTFVVTSVAMWYILRQVALVKVDVIHDRRKARQSKLDRTTGLYGTSFESTSVFNPSEAEIPLNPSDAPYDAPYQQWDDQGRAVGYTGDPQVYAPQPRRVDNPFGSGGGLTPSRTGSNAGQTNTGLAQPPPGAAEPARSPYRQESTDTVGWEIQNNPSSFPLSQVGGVASPPPRLPPLSEPYEDPFSSSVTLSQPTYAPPPGPPPQSFAQPPARFTSPTASPVSSPSMPLPPFGGARGPSSPSYAFGAPAHSYGSNAQGGTGSAAQRTFSPPPPSYQSADLR
ncbi:hypothetical protein SERLA73DRAFT_139624 [Serpula lacrymans var. lacrymans S7.3]|uniref:Golgi apparatus membrane protein TVP38 n=3 Tax=Serpula lacrymans var. lacrymans TaxID=341189 RepID=F8Q2K7_SERL3|nr:hypothetical protein SERLA73DRAFT_139624 [Serpula lacrymans var. lacrymans S7.3]